MLTRFMRLLKRTWKKRIKCKLFVVPFFENPQKDVLQRFSAYITSDIIRSVAGVSSRMAMLLHSVFKELVTLTHGRHGVTANFVACFIFQLNHGRHFMQLLSFVSAYLIIAASPSVPYISFFISIFLFSESTQCVKYQVLRHSSRISKVWGVTIHH